MSAAADANPSLTTIALLLFGITMWALGAGIVPLMLACMTGYVTANAAGAPSVYARSLARDQGVGEKQAKDASVAWASDLKRPQ